jgi:hypothetical protein
MEAALALADAAKRLPVNDLSTSAERENIYTAAINNSNSSTQTISGASAQTNTEKETETQTSTIEEYKILFNGHEPIAFSGSLGDSLTKKAARLVRERWGSDLPYWSESKLEEE